MMTSAKYDSLRPGVIISYRLQLSQRPIRPDRLWYGQVDDVSRSNANREMGFCYVTVLDNGYNGMQELVFFDQIEDIMP